MTTYTSSTPGNNHGAPDGITGLGNGYYAVNGVQQLLVSVDQFVADKLVKSGINRPISSLLLGADTAGGGHEILAGRLRHRGERQSLAFLDEEARMDRAALPVG